MKQFFILITIGLYLASASAQQVLIEGKVTTDAQNPLPFANIRVSGTTLGTSANSRGQYELKLAPGTYELIASYIGYISDTVKIRAASGIVRRDFSLKQTNISLPTVTVLPGMNPALEIIRKAIIRKKERAALLNSYKFMAYTKGIIKTQGDISSGNNSVGINLGGNDTIPLKISAIIENQSEGFYKKPEEYKELILARKQTANLPSSINVLTGGRLIQNFYEESVNFLGEDLPGPLSDNALSYYYYYIESTLAINNTTVYRIHITPGDDHYPGFTGSIYIAADSYDLLEVELNLNDAANTGGLFDSVYVFQQFTAFTDSMVMPVDYRLYVKANYLNLARFAFELTTILYDYKINPLLEDSDFGKAIIKVVPGADKKDSTYWDSIQSIPNTPAEEAAYERIDSLENIPQSFWDKFSFLSSRVYLNRHLAVSAPLGMYHFNRVEGHAIDFGLFLEGAAEKRLNGELNFSYGFSDKKLKEDLSAEYLLGDYRTFSVGLNVFNKLNVLFGESEEYGELIPSLLALISKYEFRNYYYTKGFEFNFSGEVFPVLTLTAGYKNHTDNSTVKKTDFSLFNRDRNYPPNQVINEVRINAVSAGFKLDFRDYIEDGYFRRRISQGESYLTVRGNIELSDKKILNSGLDYTTYKLILNGTLNTFTSLHLDYRIMGMYNRGSLYYQSLYSLPGNIDILFQRFSFRTLNVNEIFGSRVITVNLEHDYRDLIFRALKIPGLRDWGIQLSTFFNAAYSNIGKETTAYLPVQVRTFSHPFYEAGIGISQVLIPLKIEFAWRLNYRGENNFRVGINSVLF